MKTGFYIWCLMVYILSFFIDIKQAGYSLTSEFWTRFTYMFAHAGIFHLAINLLTIDILLHNLKRITNINILLCIAMIGAFLATFGSEMPLPTIGASGILYFLLGYYFARKWSSRLIIAALVIFTGNILSFHLYNANLFVHLLSIMYGFLYGAISGVIEEFKLIKYEI